MPQVTQTTSKLCECSSDGPDPLYSVAMWLPQKHNQVNIALQEISRSVQPYMLTAYTLWILSVTMHNT